MPKGSRPSSSVRDTLSHKANANIPSRRAKRRRSMTLEQFQQHLGIALGAEVDAGDDSTPQLDIVVEAPPLLTRQSAPLSLNIGGAPPARSIIDKRR